MSTATNLNALTTVHRFTTTGVTCAGCANSVTTILSRLNGVVRVQVDPAAKTAEVELQDGSITVEALREALHPAGYDLIPNNA